MTKMKKLMSVMLSFVMSFSLMAPAMAAEQVVSEVLEVSETILLSEDNREVILYTEDYENGDAKVCVVENDTIIYEGYLDRSQKQITSKDCQTGKISTHNCKILEADMIRANGVSTGYINQGRITYNYYIQGMVGGQKYLDVAYNKTTNPYATYNLAGKYANIAEVVLLFTSVYGMLSKTATALAKEVLTIADVGLGATMFVLPQFDVDAVKTTMEWRGSIGGTQMVKITGMKYDFVLKGTQNTQYEQMYHGENSYSNRDVTLAGDLYTSAWGNDLYDIVSWS